jgi:hypothetical protein
MPPAARTIGLSLVEALAAAHLDELKHEVMAVLAGSLFLTVVGWFIF